MNKRLSYLRSESGFGIIGVVIAAAILMIVILALSRATVDSIFLYRQFAQADEGETVITKIRDALSSDRNCSRTFGVRGASGGVGGISHALPTSTAHFDIPQILGANGKVLADTNQLPSGLRITRFEVMPLNNDDSMANLDDGMTYIGQIRVYFEKSKIRGNSLSADDGGVVLTQRVFPVTFEKDATGVNFQSCVSGKSLAGNDLVWILKQADGCVGNTALSGIDSNGNLVCAPIPAGP